MIETPGRLCEGVLKCNPRNVKAPERTVDDCAEGDMGAGIGQAIRMMGMVAYMCNTLLFSAKTSGSASYCSLAPESGPAGSLVFRVVDTP